MRELETTLALPKDDPNAQPATAALAVFTHLIRYGGVLSMTRDPVDIADGHAVLLQLHGVRANGGSLEEAVAEWLLKAAKAGPNEDVDA